MIEFSNILFTLLHKISFIFTILIILLLLNILLGELFYNLACLLLYYWFCQEKYFYNIDTGFVYISGSNNNEDQEDKSSSTRDKGKSKAEENEEKNTEAEDVDFELSEEEQAEILKLATDSFVDYFSSKVMNEELMNNTDLNPETSKQLQEDIDKKKEDADNWYNVLEVWEHEQIFSELDENLSEYHNNLVNRDSDPESDNESTSSSGSSTIAGTRTPEGEREASLNQQDNTSVSDNNLSNDNLNVTPSNDSTTTTNVIEELATEGSQPSTSAMSSTSTEQLATKKADDVPDKVEDKKDDDNTNNNGKNSGSNNGGNNPPGPDSGTGEGGDSSSSSSPPSTPEGGSPNGPDSGPLQNTQFKDLNAKGVAFSENEFTKISLSEINSPTDWKDTLIFYIINFISAFLEAVSTHIDKLSMFFF